MGQFEKNCDKLNSNSDPIYIQSIANLLVLHVECVSQLHCHILYKEHLS